MSKVVVITDIHGNLPALQAALSRVEEIAPDALYCGGDLVGYGPWPNEVCRTIEDRSIPTIYGNYDYAIGRDEEDCGCAYVTQHDRDLGQLSVDWTLEHTDQRSKDFMRELPFDLRFELGGQRVCLVHGSPRKVNEYLFEDKPAHTFERIAAEPTATCLSSVTPTNLGSPPSVASCSSTVAQSESPRTAIRAPGSPSSSSTRPASCARQSSGPPRRPGGGP